MLLTRFGPRAFFCLSSLSAVSSILYRLWLRICLRLIVVSSRPISALVDCRVPHPSKPSPPFAHWCQCHHLAHSSSAECHRELYCAVLCPCHANSGYWLLVHQPSSMSPRAFHPALVPTPQSSSLACSVPSCSQALCRPNIKGPSLRARVCLCLLGMPPSYCPLPSIIDCTSPSPSNFRLISGLACHSIMSIAASLIVAFHILGFFRESV